MLNHEKLNLKSKYTPFPNNFTNCIIQLGIDSINYHGQGFALNKKIALSKSLSELCERYLCVKLNIPSNGVAAHPDLLKARKNATLELVERDAFMIYAYTNLCPIEVTSPNINENKLNIEKGLQIKFFSLPTFSNIKTILCIIFSSNKGITLGAKSIFTNDSTYCPFQASFNEAYSIRLSSERLISPLTLDKFILKKNPTVSDHISLGLNEDYSKLFLDQFCTGEQLYKSNIPEFDLSLIKEEAINTADTPFEDIDLHIVKSSSSQLQSILFGNNIKERIDRDRINRLHTKNTTLALNLPHPFS